MSSNFKQQVEQFNAMYKLPAYGVPIISMMEFLTPDDFVTRLRQFKLIMLEELDEVEDLIMAVEKGATEVEILTELADWLGDLQVYCASEMLKFGLDNDAILHIIMSSNMSKLDENGNPIYDARGKVMKGPGYWRPEPAIKSYIEIARK